MDCTGPQATNCHIHWQEVFRRRRDKTHREAGRRSSSHQRKYEGGSLLGATLGSRQALMEEEGMQTRACRSAVREQCTPLPGYQLQCQDARQTVTDSRATSARGRP